MSACAKARQPDHVAKLMCLGPMLDEPESFKLDKSKGFAGVVICVVSQVAKARLA